MMTISHKCKCGALIAAPIFALPLIEAFTAMHNACITQTSNEEEDHGPGGDVYTNAERSRPHSEPELTTGFQRVVW